MQEVEQTRVYQRRPVRKGKPRWLKAIGWFLLGAMLFLGGAAFGFYQSINRFAPGSVLPPGEYEGRLNILLLGIDGGVNGKLQKEDVTGTRSDVMILASIDPETKQVGLLSIPRDTRVYIPDIGDYEKITHAHAYGGPELAVTTVEEFLKVNIHHYVRVDFEGFKKLVDILGGIEIDVPTKMDYDDPYQNLHIHLKPGLQTLDGQKALEFVRFRGFVDGDIGRIRNQELFLKAVMDKAISFASISKIPTIIKEIQPYIVTDMTNQDILYLAQLCLGIRTENVKMAILPGQPGMRTDGEQTLSYWIADTKATEQVVDELIRGIDRERNASIRIAVKNGSGIQGAAEYLATMLRRQGFSVVYVGNADKMDYLRTRVIAQKDNKEDQELVFRFVRNYAAAPEMKTQDPGEADITIIIGKDFRK